MHFVAVCVGTATPLIYHHRVMESEKNERQHRKFRRKVNKVLGRNPNAALPQSFPKLVFLVIAVPVVIVLVVVFVARTVSRSGRGAKTGTSTK